MWVGDLWQDGLADCLGREIDTRTVFIKTAFLLHSATCDDQRVPRQKQGMFSSREGGRDEHLSSAL